METEEKKLALEEPRSRIYVPEVRCGSCMFFKHAIAFQKSPCSEQGIRKHSRPCSKFIVSSHQHSQKTKEAKQIRQLLHQFADERLEKVIALLIQEVRARKQGFHYGQVAVIRAFGDDYLSNYFRVRVISADKEHVFVQGMNSKFFAQVLHKSILTLPQFEKKKQSLVSRGRFNDPRLAEYTKIKIKVNTTLDYTPPSIDMLEAKPKRAKTNATITRIRGNS